MLKFIARRILETIPVLLIIITGSFFLMHAAPGGPFDSERRVTPEIQRNLEAHYGLNKPLGQQYLDYLGRLVLHGDFGPSFKYANRTVNELIDESLPVSLRLGVYGMLIALVIGVTAGIVASLRPNTATDYVPMTLAMTGICLPTFVLGPLLVLLFAMKLKWFNPSGWYDPADAVLPSLTLGIYYAAYLARLTRGGMLEVLSQDYIRTAQGQGGERVARGAQTRRARRAAAGGEFPGAGAGGDHQRVVRGGVDLPDSRIGPVFRDGGVQPGLHDGDGDGDFLCGADHLFQPAGGRVAGVLNPRLRFD